LVLEYLHIFMDKNGKLKGVITLIKSSARLDQRKYGIIQTRVTIVSECLVTQDAGSPKCSSIFSATVNSIWY